MRTYKKNEKGGLGSKAVKILAALIVFNIALHVVFTLITEKGNVHPVSHRGAAGLAPENTLAAVKAGVDAGAPFVEIDIRLTSDGVPVLMHDSSLDRTTDGTGYVRERNWGYVKRLDAGSHFSDKFKGEPVPDLGTVLEFMKGYPSTLVIEVKDPAKNPGIGDVLAENLRKYTMGNKVVVISFDARWLEEFGRLTPDAALGVLYVYPFSTPPPGEVKYVSVFWPAFVLDPSLVWRMKKEGFTVWAWNIDSYYVAKFLVWKGVDGMTLDRPGMMGGFSP